MKKSAKRGTPHKENLARLARIEGQVRGIRRMVEEEAYCIEIINQVQAVRSALQAVSRRVLRKHLEHCVTNAVQSGSERDRAEKLQELMDLLGRAERL